MSILRTDMAILWFSSSSTSQIQLILTEEGRIHIANVSSLAISEDYLYAAGGDYPGGVHIYDVSDPANPTQVGQYSLPAGPQKVAVSGSSAFVADYNEGLYVLDIENPSQPTLAGFYHTPGTAYGVAGHGDYALVADLYYLGISLLGSDGWIRRSIRYLNSR